MTEKSKREPEFSVQSLLKQTENDKLNSLGKEISSKMWICVRE